MHYERAYSVEEISKVIRDTGLELTGIYGDLTFKILVRRAKDCFSYAGNRKMARIGT